MRIPDRLSNACFQWVHGRNLVYNTCWEDPRIDREALELGPDHAVLVITSAGCNALDYALQEPRVVHCVDVNPRQNALLQLKLAGIAALAHSNQTEAIGLSRSERQLPHHGQARNACLVAALGHLGHQLALAGAGIETTLTRDHTDGISEGLVEAEEVQDLRCSRRELRTEPRPQTTGQTAGCTSHRNPVRILGHPLRQFGEACLQLVHLLAVCTLLRSEDAR